MSEQFIAALSAALQLLLGVAGIMGLGLVARWVLAPTDAAVMERELADPLQVLVVPARARPSFADRALLAWLEEQTLVAHARVLLQCATAMQKMELSIEDCVRVHNAELLEQQARQALRYEHDRATVLAELRSGRRCAAWN